MRRSCPHRGEPPLGALWRPTRVSPPDHRRPVERDLCNRVTSAGQISLAAKEGPLSYARSPPLRGAIIHTPSTGVVEVRDGKAARTWVYWDTARLLRQLGVMPG